MDRDTEINEDYGHEYPRRCPDPGSREGTLGSLLTEGSSNDNFTLRDCEIDVSNDNFDPILMTSTSRSLPPLFTNESDHEDNNEDIEASAPPDSAIQRMPTEEESLNTERRRLLEEEIRENIDMLDLPSTIQGTDSVDSLLSLLNDYDPMNQLFGDEDIPVLDNEEEENSTESSEDEELTGQYPTIKSPEAGPSNILDQGLPPVSLIRRKEQRTKRDPNFWNREIPDDSPSPPPPLSPRVLRNRQTRKKKIDPDFVYSIVDSEFTNENCAALRINYADKREERFRNLDLAMPKMDNPKVHWRIDPFNFSHELHEWDKILLEPPTRILPGESQEITSVTVQSIDELKKLLKLDETEESEDEIK
jgi:hypothetical protein